MKGLVFYNKDFAGTIERDLHGKYIFRYDDRYFTDPAMPSISLTLSKRKQEYLSENLFSFFAGLLAEGINKEIQCRYLKIDENDHFRRLLLTADKDTIGPVTVRQQKDQ